MSIVKKAAALALAAATASGCASSGGKGTVTYADGTTRDISLPEFLGCMMVLFLFCPKSGEESSSTSSTSSTLNGGKTTSLPAPAMRTWRDYEGGTPSLESLEVTRGDEASFGEGIASGYLSTSDGGFLTLDVQGQKLRASAEALPGRPGLAKAASADGSTAALIANPRALGWSYQSFGVWNRSAPADAAIGASSFGNSTPGSAVPLSGSASFTGTLAGYHVSPSGARSSAAADVRVGVDFGARSLSFASSATQLHGGAAGPVAAPNLDLSGRMSYAPGSGSFSGSLANAAGSMSGGTQGRFYGPAAQELGGVFAVRGNGESFTGAYGAKR